MKLGLARLHHHELMALDGSTEQGMQSMFCQGINQFGQLSVFLLTDENVTFEDG